MRRIIGFGEVLKIEFGIELGCGNVCVPKHFLDRA
jgi:hypothetical protein